MYLEQRLMNDVPEILFGLIYSLEILRLQDRMMTFGRFLNNTASSKSHYLLIFI